MSGHKTTKQEGSVFDELAKEAQELEETAKAGAETGGWQRLTHAFQEPFRFEGKTFQELTFDWNRLTGADSIAIEDEILTRTRKTVVSPKFSSEYLCGMAIRACVSKSEEGQRFDLAAMRALPLGVFQKICGSARNFLILAEL